MCQGRWYKKNEKAVHTGQLYTPISCGKCSQCLKQRIGDWCFRLKQEAKVSTSVRFITLTYSDDFVPISDGFFTLRKSDLQKFFKRLRKLQNEPLKYFAVGEYGDRTHRPHYHMILYNLKDDSFIDAAWQKGFVDVQPLKHDGAYAYTVSYILGLKKHAHRAPEFSCMSKKLGHSYMTPQMVKWHKTDLTRQYVRDGQYQRSMPRYYRDRIFDEYEKEYISQYLEYMANKKIDDIINRLIDEHDPNPQGTQEIRSMRAKHCKVEFQKVKL